jgi:DNA-binding transcriptional LysR family regulator
MTAAAEACGQPGMRRILRVSAPTTFATRWLIPRLESFHDAHSLVEVSVTTVTTGHEELRGGFDVAVRRGAAAADAWPQHRAARIFDDADTLVMSPALFAQREIRRPADIAGHVLLSSETRPGDWIDWLEKAGLAHMAGQRRRIFDHFHVTLQAIVDGLGIGIGPLPLLDADLRTGRLVAPLPDITVPRSGYVALVPFDADKTAPFKGFVDWLVAEGKAGAARP